MGLNFQSRVLLTIGLGLAAATTVSIYVSVVELRSNGERSLVEKSRAILSRVEAARSYVAEMGVLKNIIEQVKHDHPDGNLSDESRKLVLKAVPVYAAFRVGQEGADKDGFQFRVFANNPRNEKNKPTARESQYLERFAADPNLKEITEKSEDGMFQLTIKPVRLAEAQGCLHCHGAPATSPWGNGKDILGRSMENMKDGDLKGAFAIVSSLAPVEAAVKETTVNIAGWGSGIAGLSLLISFLVLRRPLKVLDSTIQQLNQGSETMVNSSQEIFKSSQDLRSSIDTQASALQQTLVAIDEINSTVNHNAQNAEQSKALAVRTQSAVGEGRKTVADVSQSINEIKSATSAISEAIEVSNREIEEITRVIADINEKTKVINDIVFQTKLLSFNASVEAARAGEHGKGFAVVAEEIGSLAQLSGKAAQEINTMLTSSVDRVNRIVNDNRQRVSVLIESANHTVQDGHLKSQACGRSFDQILNDANELTAVVDYFAVATKEQAIGVNEISKAMAQLEQVSLQASQTSAKTEAEASQISNQSDSIKNVVKEIKSVLSGSAA